MSFSFLEPLEEPVPVFATPPSSPKVVDVEARKRVEKTLLLKWLVVGVLLPSWSAATGKGVEVQPPIQPGETEFDYYYRSYAEEWSCYFHRPPWNILQGDNVMNNPSASRETLRGLGTPVETAQARGLSRQNLQSQLASMLVGGSIIPNAVLEDYNILARREEETIRLRTQAEVMMKVVREGAEQLEKETTAFKKLKQTKMWAASASPLPNCFLISASFGRKLVLERMKCFSMFACAAKVLADADADHTKLNKVMKELQSQVTILEEVTSRGTKAEARARQAEEVRDGLTTSLGRVTEDHAWMRQRGIEHILETILDAPENATAVVEMNERACQAVFKAGYNNCLSDVNPFFSSRFIDEISRFHGKDTEAAYDAAVDA
ncbi:hypothetical protein Hanom_Chr06g00560031 [Helianthus anomalus]